eukprot:4511199-Lingulodinium_polyedra.AAC.1
MVSGARARERAPSAGGRPARFGLKHHGSLTGRVARRGRSGPSTAGQAPRPASVPVGDGGLA